MKLLNSKKIRGRTNNLVYFDEVGSYNIKVSMGTSVSSVPIFVCDCIEPNKMYVWNGKQVALIKGIKNETD